VLCTELDDILVRASLNAAHAQHRRNRRACESARFRVAQYTMLLPLHQRLVYETSAPERGTVLDVPGSAAICSLYTWCFVVADITIMMLAYVKFSSSVGFGSGTCSAREGNAGLATRANTSSLT
jgi:hypothetical protein